MFWLDWELLKSILVLASVKQNCRSTPDAEDEGDDDCPDAEDQEAAEDIDPSWDASDDRKLAEISAEVALTHTVSAADSKVAQDAIRKVCCYYSLLYIG